MSTNSNTPSIHSSYTPPTTSRFLALGKSNPKYPPGLGKALPSTLSKGASITRKASQSTLSALAPAFVPRSASGASGSSASSSVSGSIPLRPKNHPPARPTKLVLNDQVASSNTVTHTKQHQNVPAQYSPQFPVSFSVVIFYFCNLNSLIDIRLGFTSFHLSSCIQSQTS